jgi:hypothetical protein
MTEADRDPVLDRALSELRALPPLDREAVSRIVAAAAVARVSPADDDDVMAARSPGRAVRWSWTVGIAAAAAIAGFVVRGVWMSPRDSSSPNPTPAVASSPTGLRPAADVDADSRPVPKQFVLQNSVAKRVSLVGDFNNWNPAADPLTRDPASGLWTRVIPISPGRHVYGFMIDDSVLVLDPRAPKTKDPSLGVEGSVIIVGKP